MKSLASLTAALGAIAVPAFLFSAPVLTVATAQTSAPASGESLDGKEIFLAQKCNLCHSVSTAGIEATTKSEKLRGPDLVDLDRDAEWLAGWLKKEIELNGQKHKKEFKGSEEELDALIAWLLKQRK